MGVYIFRSCHAQWFKLGHHKLRPARPTVYHRIAGRGFYSCVAPPCLHGRLGIDNFELLAWYPTLTKQHEGALHRKRICSYGEFHPADELEQTLKECDVLGQRIPVDSEARSQAMAWALKTGKRQRDLGREVVRAGAQKATPEALAKRQQKPQRVNDSFYLSIHLCVQFLIQIARNTLLRLDVHSCSDMHRAWRSAQQKNGLDELTAKRTEV